MSDFVAMMKAYEMVGGDPSVFEKTSKVAKLVVSGNSIITSANAPGVVLEGEGIPDGIKARVKVAPGTVVKSPVHLCFGVLPPEGLQMIISEFEIGEGAKVEFVAHCTFPNAVKVKHVMDARINVGKNATMRYRESHYHGELGGTEVLPRAAVKVEEGGMFATEFALTVGRVGLLDFDYEVDVQARGVAELTTKAYGYDVDSIKVKETIRLNGEYARGLAKARIAVKDRATSEVIGTTEGNAPFTRGHVDCIEIVRDEAVANAIPVVRVRDHRAYVTHEAAIGTVDKKELETLMARGLEESEAVDTIIRGMLR